MVLNNFKKLKLIAVDEQNYERLRRFGNTPDSFNKIIGRILTEVEMLEPDTRFEAGNQTLTRQ